MLIFGFKTRFATIMVWLFTISLIARNPAVITGAYVILRLALFWAIFLPLGAKWSIDESLDINKEKSQDRVSSIASNFTRLLSIETTVIQTPSRATLAPISKLSVYFSKFTVSIFCSSSLFY